MQTKTFYRATNGTDYELTIEHDDGQYVPRYLSEGPTGTIVDLTGERTWDSIMEMTQDLEVEIISWGSDVGD